MGHRYLGSLCCATLILLPACSGAGAPEAAAPEPGTSTAAEPEESAGDTGDKEPARGARKKLPGQKDRSEDGSPDRRGPGSDSPAPRETVTDDSESSSGASTPPPTGAEKEEAAAFPPSGTYVYAQEGYEEFCSGASCDRSELPSRQRISSRVVGRTGAATAVLTTLDAGKDRLVKTTTAYSHSTAAVTSVFARFGYRGFVFENDYEPNPAVEILRFPLRAGDTWSGEWEADVSGTYKARVVGRERINVGDRTVNAFKIATSTSFSGEFSGTSDAQIWIDPVSRATVRTSGLVRLRMNFGDYNTAFQTALKAAPSF